MRVLVIPVVVTTVLAGVWVAGGVISNDFRTSMALTAVWFAISGTACLIIARRWRPLRIPVVVAFVLTAGATGAYLGVTTLRDRVVHEQVITRSAGAQAEGSFRSHEHRTAGTARVVRAVDGRRFLTLTSFSTSPGPDLRVRLVPRNSFDGGTDGAIDLGGLKGNRGDQQYEVPAGVNVTGRTVVIWCRAFSAPFGSATLRRATLDLSAGGSPLSGSVAT